MQPQTSNDQVVLITGASKGIGKAIAELFAKEGYKTYGTSRNGHPVADITESEESFLLVKLDVNSDESVTECVNGILDREGRIDILINNAGYGLAGPIIDTTIEEAKSQFETNFFGVHRMVRAIIPHLLKQKRGIVINVGSFAGRVALPYQGFYSASKAALAMYTDGLRMHLKDKGIKVALIEPGDIKTEFHAGRKFTQHFEQDDQAKTAIETMRESEGSAIDPRIVAKTVLNVTKKKNPKPRYLVGPDATKFGWLQRFISDSMRETLTLKYFNLPSKKKSFKSFRPNEEKPIVLITGASSGIGKTTAEYLTSRGYKVYGTSRNGMPVQELDKNNSSTFPLVQLDVNEDDSVKQCVKGVLEREGRIDVLINNAGFPLLGVIWHTTVEQAKLQFETNFFGVHRMIKAVVPQMIERGHGCIINVSSIGGRICMPLIPFYSASKAALSIYTDALRMELREHGIKATTVEPGFVKTDFDQKTVFSSPRPRRRSSNSSSTTSKKKPQRPTQRGIHPIKVAKTMEKIITSRNPKPRYTIGRDAWIIKKVQAMTSRKFQEKMILRMFGKPLRRIINAAEMESNERAARP